MSKLEEMLKYVSEHNDFYKNIIREHNITDPTDITQYPILTRQQLQENRYNMFSDGYKTKYFNQQLRRQSSSGSSGVPVNVYWDYKDWYASNMSLWRKRLQWYEIKPSDKYVMFTLNAFNIKSNDDSIFYINERPNVLLVNVSLIKNDSGYEELTKIIHQFAPNWLYIQPFVLKKMIQAYERTGIVPPKTLRYIESVGELLPSDLKRRAVDFFSVQLANMYGSEEMNGIAYECHDHHMHVLYDNIYLEVKNNNGIHRSGEGNAIITNLNNMSMPLIRYNQEDIIILGNDINCPFGNSLIISVMKGRNLESIMISDKTEINEFILLEVMAEVGNQFDGIILAYRYIYRESSKSLRCYISISKQRELWFCSIKKAIEKTLAKKISLPRELSFLVEKDDISQLYGRKRKILEVIQ